MTPAQSRQGLSPSILGTAPSLPASMGPSQAVEQGDGEAKLTFRTVLLASLLPPALPLLQVTRILRLLFSQRQRFLDLKKRNTTKEASWTGTYLSGLLCGAL